MNHRQQRNPLTHPHKNPTNKTATARQKRPRYFLVRGVPFLVLVLCVALAVTFVTVIVLPHLMLTTTLSSSSSYLVDLLEDFSYNYEAKSSIKTRPWRNTENINRTRTSGDSSSTAAAGNDENMVPWVIFYHIYIPPRKGKVGQTKALEVVEEQLVQIAASRNLYMMTMSITTTTTQNSTSFVTTTTHPSVAVWTVYYTTTGVKNVITVSWMRRVCQAHSLKCIPTEPHLLVGDEHVTLNHLYDYCQYRRRQDNIDNDNDSTAANTAVVVYMHTKGTHHSAQGRNDAWRRHLTSAVTHPDCLNAVLASSKSSSSSSFTTAKLDKSCDVCGLQYVSFGYIVFIQAHLCRYHHSRGLFCILHL
jgi:hypothetical protein